MIKNYAAYKKTCFTIAFFIITFFGYSQTTTFTTTGTFTVPAGVTSITIEAWGGGGTGGGALGNPSGAGGGAGGAYVRNNSLSVTPGASYAVTVGIQTTGTLGNGQDGYPSSFALSSTPAILLINAVGGNGGKWAPDPNSYGNGGAQSSTGNIGGTTSNVYGSAGTNGTAAKSGDGGNSGGGALGGTGTNTIFTNPGSLYGGGGSGGFAPTNPDRVGGYGAAGKVVITTNPISAQAINIQGNDISIADADSTPSPTDGTDFGSTQIVSAPITKVFTIQNTGGQVLTVGAISFSGTDAANFTVTTAPSSSVAAGSSTTFVVTFNPTATGIKTAAISIVNNDSGLNKNPYNFSLQGTGTTAFFDSDGDGIFDNVDIDDDNDGILDTSEENYCNLLNGSKVNYKFLNETFGEGTTRTTINTTYGSATTTYTYEGGPGELFDGLYTVGSDVQATAPSWAPAYWYNGLDHTAGDTNGRMGIFNAAETPGIFYTALITGALPNTPVTYSFWVINLDRTDAPSIGTRIRPNIKVEFRDVNDAVLQTIITGDIAPTTAGNAVGDWYQFTANLTFNVSTFKVVFINNNPGGNGNDLAIDDIAITQNLCDEDRDSIADVFDLDSDNDGIPDVVEAGLGNLSAGKGKIAVAWVDANANGMYDAAEANVALDSDGDGVPNYLDLDSDNDSVFDIDESGAGNTNAVAGYLNGDGDSNGDGTGDGLETETFRSKDTNGDTILEGFGDGILDIFDYGTAANQYGNLGQGIATTYLKDTDGDGIPDYLDLISNGSTFDIANNKLIYDYKTIDANNDGILDGATDIDKDGVLDSFDTNTAQFGSPRDLNTKLFLDFDGRNDYGQSTAILGGLANASLMAWIDLNPAFSADGVVVGQDNFQIRITSGKLLEAAVNGSILTYPVALNISQWYNIGATYDATNLKLYLNGALVATNAVSGAIAADASLLTLGKNPSTNSKYFKGKIDEVRVFNLALNASQLQKMVYQEIKNNGSEIQGEIAPKNIATSPASLPFANLLRYYRMDTYKDDIIDDLTTSAVDITGTKIYNHKNIYVQQAPMPFLTERTGNFATAVNSPTKEIRGLDIMDQDWSIVKVLHDITETSNNIDLGMIVNPGINIAMNNDTKIQNDWYLKLDGKIDLVGKSQLVQTTESTLDVTSAGFIGRDQQGQASKYNYNYWSSPVSPINMIANNMDYTVAGMMKDGTTTTPQNINWIGGYDGALSSPISLARYWIYKFDNSANAYANWSQISETDLLRVGQGFTLKGSGALSGTQNYTFVGKPNNGTIDSNSVSADQLLLTGNPYPSAMDANAFINDNLTSMDGTLYFWEHYATNDTHILRDCQGGYATRNLTGGVPATSSGIDFISGLGSTSRGIPNQFIPVGQSFFVYGNIGSGGPIIYKNSQRGFHKEDEVGVSNVMYKSITNTKKDEFWNDNNNDIIEKDTYKRIRLGYNSSNNYHRQVLIGFMDEKATSGMDYGYDGLNFDDFPNDMFLLKGENQLVIEGEGFFDSTASYPIGVKTEVEGKVSFVIDGLENFEPDQAIYIFDNETEAYHDIRNQAFAVQLPVGLNKSRFSLRFVKATLGVEEETIVDNSIKIHHLQNTNLLIINNGLVDVAVQKVTLYNVNGQSVTSWKIENQEQNNIQIPIGNLSSGVYITKLKTSKGDISKKIIIP